MIKPTKHYETLRRWGLAAYWHDDSYETLAECRAHVLLDIMVWMDDPQAFYAAVRRCGELAIAQHDQAISDLEGIGAKLLAERNEKEKGETE